MLAVILLLGLLGTLGFFIYDLLHDNIIVAHAERIMDWLLDQDPLLQTVAIALFAGVWSLVPFSTSIVCVGTGLVLRQSLPQWMAVLIGVAVVSLGVLWGSVAAFLLGRYLLRRLAARTIKRHRILQGLDLGLLHRGARVSFLLHLAPVVPLSLCNYALGATSIAPCDFLLGLAGFLPYVITFVCLGALSTTITDVGASAFASVSLAAWQWALAAAAAALAAAAAVAAAWRCTHGELASLVASAHAAEEARRCSESPPGSAERRRGSSSSGGSGSARAAAAAAARGTAADATGGLLAETGTGGVSAV